MRTTAVETCSRAQYGAIILIDSLISIAYSDYDLPGPVARSLSRFRFSAASLSIMIPDFA